MRKVSVLFATTRHEEGADKKRVFVSAQHLNCAPSFDQSSIELASVTNSTQLPTQIPKSARNPIQLLFHIRAFKMERRALISGLILLLALSTWFVCRIQRGTNYQVYYPEFYDQEAGRWIKPRELIKMWHAVPSRISDDLINNTNSWQRLQEVMAMWALTNIVKKDFTYDDKRHLAAAGGAWANQEACQAQLGWVRGAIDSMGGHDLATIPGTRAEELNNLLESFGQPDSGSMHNGRNWWSGSQLACESSSLNGRSIQTRQCAGQFRHKDWKSKGLTRGWIRVDLCLPRACDSNSFHQNREQIEHLAKYYWPTRYKDNMVIQALYCPPDAESWVAQMPIGGRILLACLAAWVCLVLLVSVRQELQSVKSHSKCETTCKSGRVNDNKRDLWFYLDAISIQNSMAAFLERVDQRPEARVDFRPFDCIKSQMSIFIVLGHSLAMTIFHSRVTVHDWFNDFSRLSMSFGRLNDTFYITFGALLAFNILSSIKRKYLGSPITWIKINIIAFVRVFPLFFLTHWINRVVSPYLSSSPHWDYGLGNSMKTICRFDPWWKSIPYFGNFGTQEMPHCNVPSWFVVAYCQLTLICPILVYVLDRLSSNKSRLVLVAFTILLSTAHTSIKFLQQQVFPADIMSFFGTFVVIFVDKYEPSGYFDALSRLGCASIGCFMGLHLYRYNKDPNAKWPSWLISRRTIVAVLIMKVFIFIMPVMVYYGLMASDYRMSATNLILVNGSVSMVWPVLNAILLLNLITVYKDSLIARFMQHPFWSSFNKLGLAISLIHFEVAVIANMAHETANSYSSIMEASKVWAFSLSVSIALGMLFFAFIEAPLGNLFKIFTMRKVH